MGYEYDPKKAHETYLRRKAEGKIPKSDPQKQKEASKRYYEKKKAALKAQGLSTYYMNGGKPKKSRTKEEAHEYYLKRKEQGLAQKQYQDKIKEDPLFNRKQHIKRKKADEMWLTKRADRNNVLEWIKIITMIRESDLPTEELAEKIALKKRAWKLCNNTQTRKDTDKTVYRPRIKNTVLTEKQIEELTDYTLAQGLSSEMEMIKTTVEYDGEMRGIEDKRDEKIVDIYTAQSRFLEKDLEQGKILARRLE